MDDMKVSSSFDCPSECNTIKFTVRKEVAPIDVSKYCLRPKSIFNYLKLTVLYDFSELYNFFYSKVFNKYKPNKRYKSNAEVDAVIEEICQKMIMKDMAVVSIYFPHGTYTRIEQTLKVTLTDKIASFGKFLFKCIVSSWSDALLVLVDLEAETIDCFYLTNMIFFSSTLLRDYSLCWAHQSSTWLYTWRGPAIFVVKPWGGNY